MYGDALCGQWIHQLLVVHTQCTFPSVYGVDARFLRRPFPDSIVNLMGEVCIARIAEERFKSILSPAEPSGPRLFSEYVIARTLSNMVRELRP